MDMLDRIGMPNLRPMPTRPQSQPGFRGALKDALRGMIPGYIQGQEAGLKEQRQDVGIQNQQEMALWKEQMGLVKPMLTKDYETEAWMQKVNMTRNYLMTTYPFMTEAEIAARSLGQSYRQPTPPKPGIPHTFIMPDGKTRITAVMNEQRQWVKPGGEVIPPEIMNQAVEVAKQSGEPDKPHYFTGVTPPEGGDPQVGYTTPDDPGNMKYVQGAKVWKDPEAAAARQAAREAAAASRSNAQELARQRLDLAQSKFIDSQTARFDASQIVRKYNESMETISDILHRDMSSPANQESLLYAFAKVNDPRTGVREPERETIRKNVGTLVDKFGRDVMRVVNNVGSMSPHSIQLIKSALVERKRSLQEQYDNYREQTAKTIKAKTGEENPYLYMTDHAVPYEERMTSPMGELRKNSRGNWVPVR